MKKLYAIVVFFVILFIPSVYAQEFLLQESQLKAAEHQLIIDQKGMELAKNQLLQLKKNHSRMIQYFQETGVSLSTLKHSEIEIVSVRTSINGLQMTLDSVKEQQSRIQSSIDELNKEKRRLEILKGEEPAVKTQLYDIDQKFNLASKLLEVENNRLDILRLTRGVTTGYLDALIAWNQELYVLRKQQSRDKIIAGATAKMKSLQVELDQWIAKLTSLNNRLAEVAASKHTSDTEIQKINFEIIEANENVELSRLDVFLLSIESEVQATSEAIVNNLNIPQLNHLELESRKTKRQLEQAEHFVHSKIQYLDMKKTEHLSGGSKESLSSLMMMISTLQHRYEEQDKRVEFLRAKTEKVELKIRDLLHLQISTRQVLPGFDANGWANLFHKALQIPGLVVQTSKSSIKQLKLYCQDVSDLSEGMLFIIGLLVLLSSIVMRYLLNLASTRLYARRQRFTMDILYTVVELVRRTLFSLYLLGILIFVNITTGAHLTLFIYLTLVFVLFKMLTHAVRISLLESGKDIGGRDVIIYYELKWAFLLGAILFSVIVMTHQLPVAYEVKALSNRVFMIFILIVGLLLFKGRYIVPEVLDTKLDERRRYVYHALRLLTFLLPIGLIFNAIIGLLGYVDLAWMICKMQITFLLVVATYLIVRGLIIDFFDYSSELIIKKSNNGWVWTEAFINPADKIVRVFLVIAAIFALVHFYELDHNTRFVNMTTNTLNKNLFTLAGNVITPIVLIKLFIFVIILYWVARWSREFSLRLLYKQFKDVGVRNSLSKFTQYAVVITGVLIGLQFIGMDLTGITVITAAFFAGIGFGLRDMANNYFSGVLMLIERPFRNGDTVKVGEFEGEVIHLGLRSTTVRTWDHMEVIIPNSDMFNKPFVNWTHQDSIVRSVITINVSAADNPHRIHELVLQILANHKDVLDKPEPAVLMRDIDNTFVEMEVRYFIMIGPETSRVIIRSEILFAIWDCFKANGIHSPVPQYDITIRE